MPALPLLSGPSAEPASGRPARQLIVLLHGVGANGDDLMGVVPFAADALPDAAFVAPDGPAPYDLAPFGRQWFSLADRGPAALASGVRAAAPAVDAFLDAQLAARGLDDSALALVGFSQGTMLALQVAYRRPRALAAVVGFAGAVIAAESLPGEIRSRPPTLLIHGEADEVVNPLCLPQSESALAAVGVPVLARSLPGIGHTIDGTGLGMAIAFLRRCFGVETE